MRDRFKSPGLSNRSRDLSEDSTSKKTHFKAMTTVFMRQGGVLNFDKEDPKLTVDLKTILWKNQ